MTRRPKRPLPTEPCAGRDGRERDHAAALWRAGDWGSTLGERLSAGALARRAAAIAAEHRSHGLASPASDPTVTKLLRQARRNATSLALTSSSTANLGSSAPSLSGAARPSAPARCAR
jgi:hypothetical protein